MRQLSFLFLNISLISCSSIILRMDGTFDEDVKIKVVSNKHKILAFVPMHHVGRKEYYSAVTETIDSLNQQGYTCFFEGVKFNISNHRDSILIEKKLRKVLGFFLDRKSYVDSTNHWVGKLRYTGKHKLIYQPKPYALYVDPKNSIHADLSIEKLIEEIEKKFGPITLNDCDINTPLDSSYNCGKSRRKQETYLTYDLRNKHLAELITESKNKKISVMYGASHFSGLFSELKKRDPNWKKIGPNLK